LDRFARLVEDKEREIDVERAEPDANSRSDDLNRSSIEEIDLKMELKWFSQQGCVKIQVCTAIDRDL
jgi:hypothetical protein